MAVGIQQDVTFEELVSEVDRVVTRLKQEIANREILESMADDADDLAPGEFGVYIEYQGSMFKVSPAKLGIDSFAPLVEPIRQGNAEASIALVEELGYAYQALRDFCQPPEAPGGQDEPGPAAGPGPEPAPAAPEPQQPAPAAPGGLLAALQSRRAAAPAGAEPADDAQP